MSVSQDATSLKYLPANTTEWNELLANTGLPAPSSLYGCQEASGSLVDSVSARNATAFGSVLYQQTVPGWSRKGVKASADNGANYFATAVSSIPNVNANSVMLLEVRKVGTDPASGFRGFNNIGIVDYASAQLVPGKLLRAREVSNFSSIGTTGYSGDLILVTKLDIARGEFVVYSSTGEVLKSGFTTPTSSTQMLYMGDGLNGTNSSLMYMALWTGLQAQMSDAEVATLLARMSSGPPSGGTPTLSVMQNADGPTEMKLVVAVEGCPYLLSDASSAAVLASWVGTDWAQVISGLFVEINNRQELDLHDPFTRGGDCTIRVCDPDGDDVFGKFVGKRTGGAETSITATVDKDDTTIPVKYGTGLTASGEMYIGSECVGYSSRASTTVTANARGKYSPFASAGSGGSRFANHHRVGFDPNHVMQNPVVTQIPRMWVGKRVGVWLHTWDGTTMNSRANAQLIYAGRIVEVDDDSNNGHTVLSCKHVLDEVRDAVIGKDLWGGTVAPGLWLSTGRLFKFYDWKDGSRKTANDLTVVASGATGTNQINQGMYSLTELCEALNKWKAGELIAGRIWGNYSWNSPVSSNVGMRTMLYWGVNTGTTPLATVTFGFSMPGEVFGFLGLGNLGPSGYQQMVTYYPQGGTQKSDTANRDQGFDVPFHTVVYRPLNPAHLAQEFTEAMYYDVENERGTFTDQRALFPASIKESCPAGNNWGLFLLDEKTLMVGSYNGAGRLVNCWLAPFQFAGDKDAEATPYIGRRADDPGEPISVRQIFVFESTLEVLVNTLFYNTGTVGYNHPDYDNLGYGLGVGIPGELLGPAFEKSLANLSGVSMPLAVIIDKPTKLTDIIGADLLLRRAFLRWKNEHLEIATWKTPTASDAVLTLSEANKSAPVSQNQNHRVASRESAEFQRPVVKINYNRDFSSTRGDTYLRSVMIEDQVAVDDAGGNAKPFTINLRNCYSQFTNTGAAVEALIPEYISTMPAVSRAARKINRSLGLPHFEGYSVGDVAIVNDDFARDPLTGARGVLSRPALVTAHGYDLGGPPLDPEGEPRPMSGDVELFFLDLNRGRPYSYAAQIDEGQTNAGYNSGTFSLLCYTHKFSEGNAIPDAQRFAANDKITIVEMDPANVASPVTWDRTVSTVVGNQINLTAALSSPAWDAAKKYFIVPQHWAVATPTQRDQAFQADDADDMIEDTEVPYHYTATQETLDFDDIFVELGGTVGRWRTFTPNVRLNYEMPEFVASLLYGDGKAYDLATERKIANMVNAFIDYKSAHECPVILDAWPQPILTTADWGMAAIIPVFFGTEQLTNSVTRTLTVAPWFRSHNGSTAQVRVTLSRSRPVGPVGGSDSIVNKAYFKEQFSQATWSTSSTSWTQGADTNLSLGVKDLQLGIAYLVAEIKGPCNFHAFAKMHENIRTVS